MWLWIFLALPLCSECTQHHGDILFRSSLDEGGPCVMEDGRPGVCKKLTDCPHRVKEVLSGLRGQDSSGRCGFDGHTEIVCCTAINSLQTRPADMYREKRRKLLSQISIGFGQRVTEKMEFPYAAVLGYRNDQGEIEYTCGGSLISFRHVLTAAHCVHNMNGRVPVEVRLGDLNLKNTTANTQRIPIKSFVWHEKYSKFRRYHDVAVITLENFVYYSTSVSAICLPTDVLWQLSLSEGYSDNGSALLAIGWGSAELNGPLSDDLMKTSNLSLIERTICTDLYKNSAQLPYGISEEMICALDRNSSRRSDACTGDSGGPLVYRTELGDAVFGITAFGQGCSTNEPGIYTAVYPYIDWIEEIVFRKDRSTDSSEMKPDTSTKKG